jgi:hypothetical protein
MEMNVRQVWRSLANLSENATKMNQNVRWINSSTTAISTLGAFPAGVNEPWLCSKMIWPSTHLRFDVGNGN